MAELPAWECRTEAQRRALADWTARQIEGRLAARLTELGERPEAIAAVEALAASFERARAELPYLTYDEFLRLRRLPVQTRPGAPEKPLHERMGDVANAALDYRIIKELWAEAYGKDRRVEAPTALEIAAARWGVDEDTLTNHLKKSGDKRPEQGLLRP